MLASPVRCTDCRGVHLYNSDGQIFGFDYCAGPHRSESDHLKSFQQFPCSKLQRALGHSVKRERERERAREREME